MSAKFSTPIVVASSNLNKVAELQTAAGEFGYQLLSGKQARDQFGLSEPPDVDETGTTYRANALLKAEAFARWSGLPSLGDDSGLEVTALENRPGLYSARYGGEGLTSEQRYLKLLAELEDALRVTGSTDRSARFRSYLVLSLPGGQILEAEATLEGDILAAPRGANGFGYDPIVQIHAFGKTFAELDFSVTASRGFRALAAKKLFAQLEQI